MNPAAAGAFDMNAPSGVGVVEIRTDLLDRDDDAVSSQCHSAEEDDTSDRVVLFLRRIDFGFSDEGYGFLGVVD